MRGRGGGWVMWSPQELTSIVEGQVLASVLMGVASPSRGFYNSIHSTLGKFSSVFSSVQFSFQFMVTARVTSRISM
jgi:hypothetical protein